MDVHSLGRLLFILGVVIALLGGLLMLVGRVPFLSGFGNLPGDIRIEGTGFTCFVPLASMLILSLVLTVVLNIIVRLINR